MAYGQSLIGKLASAFPLQGVVDQVERAMRTALRGQPRDQVEGPVRQAICDTAFLIHLHQGVNSRVLEAEENLRLQMALVLEGLRGLLLRAQLGEELAWTRNELARALPYPLDYDIAASVQAARDNAVETWTALDEDGTVLEWVVAQYVAEGKTRLPFGAYLPELSDTERL